MEFKVGDKVRAIKELEGEKPNGIGIIKGIKGDIFSIEFLDWNEGHSGMDNNCKRPHGWCYDSPISDYLELVKKGEVVKPKIPTHLVVWEEDRDPFKFYSLRMDCEFFTSEKEARDFIKKLSEKSNVKKESIILVTIKSCQKVKISKTLKYTAHKI